MDRSAIEWRPGGSLGFQLGLTARLLTRLVDRRLVPAGVNVAYLPVLSALKDGSSLSQKELTEIGQIGQPAMAQMLDRMVREGLLNRTADPSDGRKTRFSLDKKVAGRLAAVRTVMVDANRDVFSGLSNETLQQFAETLQHVETRLRVLLKTQEPTDSAA